MFRLATVATLATVVNAAQTSLRTDVHQRHENHKDQHVSKITRVDIQEHDEDACCDPCGCCSSSLVIESMTAEYVKSASKYFQSIISEQMQNLINSNPDSGETPDTVKFFEKYHDLILEVTDEVITEHSTADKAMKTAIAMQGFAFETSRMLRQAAEVFIAAFGYESENYSEPEKAFFNEVSYFANTSAGNLFPTALGNMGQQVFSNLNVVMEKTFHSGDSKKDSEWDSKKALLSKMDDAFFKKWTDQTNYYSILSDWKRTDPQGKVMPDPISGWPMRNNSLQSLMSQATMSPSLLGSYLTTAYYKKKEVSPTESKFILSDEEREMLKPYVQKKDVRPDDEDNKFDMEDFKKLLDSKNAGSIMFSVMYCQLVSGDDGPNSLMDNLGSTFAYAWSVSAAAGMNSEIVYDAERNCFNAKSEADVKKYCKDEKDENGEKIIRLSDLKEKLVPAFEKITSAYYNGAIAIWALDALFEDAHKAEHRANRFELIAQLFNAEPDMDKFQGKELTDNQKIYFGAFKKFVDNAFRPLLSAAAPLVSAQSAKNVMNLWANFRQQEGNVQSLMATWFGLAANTGAKYTYNNAAGEQTWVVPSTKFNNISFQCMSENSDYDSHSQDMVYINDMYFQNLIGYMPSFYQGTSGECPFTRTIEDQATHSKHEVTESALEKVPGKELFYSDMIKDEVQSKVLAAFYYLFNGYAIQAADPQMKGYKTLFEENKKKFVALTTSAQDHTGIITDATNSVIFQMLMSAHVQALTQTIGNLNPFGQSGWSNAIMSPLVVSVFNAPLKKGFTNMLTKEHDSDMKQMKNWSGQVDEWGMVDDSADGMTCTPDFEFIGLALKPSGYAQAADFLLGTDFCVKAPNSQ